MKKIISREDAVLIAKKKFPKRCCFCGSLDEVWEHAREKHKVQGHMLNARLDGSIFNDEVCGGEWINTEPILVNEKNEFWFVCLELKGGV